jgi:glycosyltransferase involved in cell wall biosynthesis
MIVGNPPRIAFIKTGDFSHINTKVLEMLHSRFPEAIVDVFDTGHLPVCRAHWLPMLGLQALMQYGLKACRGRSSVRRYAQRTTGFFAATRAQLTKRMRSHKYAFTLQTQSVVDASQAGTPHFVYTDHTHLTNMYYPGFDPADLYSAKWLAKERSIYANANVIFTMSPHVSTSLMEQYGADVSRVQCVGIGSNAEIPREESLDTARYARKEIIFVGIDWVRKGGPQLVKAFAKVLQQHPDAKLTIIGCSPTIDLPNCRVLGRLPLDQISQHYRQASVFCMPTRNEPFGVVFLEAFAHRLPIVASNIGALPSLIQEGSSGYMVPPDDVDGLAARLSELISDPEKCRAFGTAGYQYTTANFTWERTGHLMSERIRREIGTI